MIRAARRLAVVALLLVLALLVTWVALEAVSRWRIDAAIDDLASPDPAVRQAAAAFLAESESPYAVSGLIAILATEARDSTQWEGAVSALARMGPRAVEPLVTSLVPGVLDGPVAKDAKRPDMGVLRWGAGDVVRRMGMPAAGALVASYEHEDENVRAIAAELTGFVGEARAGRPLLALLGDESSYVRLRAIEALGKCKAPVAVEPLVDILLRGKNHTLRQHAARALGEIGDKRAFEPLVVTLREKDRGMQSSVMRALGSLNDPRAVEVLTAIIEGGAPAAARSVRYALLQIDGVDVVPLYIEMLGDSDVGDRRLAARALGRTADPRAVEPLIAALGDADAFVRRFAAEALGSIGDPRAVEGLIAALADADALVARSAGVALGKIGGPRSIGPLVAALGGDDAPLQGIALEVLSKDRQAIEPLVAALEGADARMQRNALRALSGFKDPRVVAAVAALLRRETGEICLHAAMTLERIATKEAREAVDEFLGLDLADVAKDRRSYIEAGDVSNLWLLILALERHGTLEMAADFFHCKNPDLSGLANWWAERRGLADQLKATEDSADRPKWGGGAGGGAPQEGAQ